MLLEIRVFWFVRQWYLLTFRTDGLPNGGNYLNSTRYNVPDDRNRQVKCTSDRHIASSKIPSNESTNWMQQLITGLLFVL